jgi:hypothetical protein
MQSNTPLASGTTGDENGACLHRLCLSFLPLSVIPASAGIQRLIGLDSRLRGNYRGVGVVHTYKGIFVATTLGYNQHIVIPKQVRNDNDMERNSIFVEMTW